MEVEIKWILCKFVGRRGGFFRFPVLSRFFFPAFLKMQGRNRSRIPGFPGPGPGRLILISRSRSRLFFGPWNRERFLVRGGRKRARKPDYGFRAHAWPNPARFFWINSVRKLNEFYAISGKENSWFFAISGKNPEIAKNPDLGPRLRQIRPESKKRKKKKTQGQKSTQNAKKWKEFGLSISHFSIKNWSITKYQRVLLDFDTYESWMDMIWSDIGDKTDYKDNRYSRGKWS